MITGPVDHGLHVIWSRLNLIFLAIAMSSSSYRHIVATNSSPLYRLGHQSALGLLGAEVLYVACEPKQFALVVGSQRLLADQRLSNLVVVEQKKFPHVLQRKAIRGATSEVIRETAGRTRSGLTFGTSTSASTIHHTTQ